MMNMIKPIFGILISIVLFGCDSEPENVNSQNEFDSFESGTVDNETYQSVDQIPEEKETQINNEDGPPFSDTCLCTFEYIGEFRTRVNRFDLVLSGKGWKPEYWSCSWTWGELINNEFPPDSLVTDFRIHLVDLEKIDSNTFISNKFKDNLIATYSRLPNEEYMTCKFDPNKTGKYPKPKQWVE